MENYKKQITKELAVRNRSQQTVRAYLNAMDGLVSYFKKCPTDIGIPEIKDYLIHFKNENGIGRKVHRSANTVNRQRSGIMFYYRYVLKRYGISEEIPQMKGKRKLPIIFSPSEIQRMIDGLESILYKSVFVTLYSTGMRLAELQNLKPINIDSNRMIINIRNGKGGKDREALLSPILLKLLRAYWVSKPVKNSQWLFNPSKNPVNGNLDKKISHTAVEYIVKKAARIARTKKKSILTV